MSYELIAMLTEQANLDADRLAALMRERETFRLRPGMSISVESTGPDSVEVRWEDWSLRASLEEGTHVLAESENIAAAFAADRQDKSLIAGCRRWIVWSSDVDPDMDHFNDYCFLLEALEKQPGLILFDPRAGDFVGAA
jgi:hypothetical protein